MVTAVVRVVFREVLELLKQPDPSDVPAAHVAAADVRTGDRAGCVW